MIRKFLAAAAFFAAFGSAFAAVDANTANEDALHGIKGIGSARARAIVDERQAHGPFKDAADLGRRVKGMGGHTVERLQAEGLAVGPGGGSGPGSASAAAKTAAAAGQSPSRPQAQAATVTVKK